MPYQRWAWDHNGKTVTKLLNPSLDLKKKAVDFVTFDCTFLRHTAGEVSRHMGLEDNKAMQKEFLRRKIANEHTRYAITHYSHNNAPLKENLQKIEEEYELKKMLETLKQAEEETNAKQ